MRNRLCSSPYGGGSMNRLFTMLTLLIALGLTLASCGQAASGGAATSAPPAAGAPTAAGAGSDKTYKVGIVQQTTHPALDGAREGVKQAFSAAGLKVELIEKN